MDQLLKKSKELVDSNIKEGQNKDILELLYATTAALILKKPKLSFERLPLIFRELKILASEKTIAEMIDEYEEKTFLEENLVFCDAAVLRNFVFDSDKNTIEETITLLLSYTPDTTSVKFFKMTLHEFFHMLRYSMASKEDQQVKVKNGIEFFTFDLHNNTSIRHHRSLEDSIVQKYTNEAATGLENYLNLCENLEGNELLKRFQKEALHQQYNPYAIGTFLLDQLCLDPTFAELIDETFEEAEIPSQAEMYYDDVMNEKNAFNTHSKTLDIFQQKFLSRQTTTAQESFEILKKSTLEFLDKTKTYQKTL